MPKENALAVMLRAPVAGEVKTRLSPPLSPDEAAALYSAFIIDTFDNASRVRDIDLYAAFTPQSERDCIERLLTEEVQLILQEGEDLGERLAALFKSLFSLGHKRVAVIGSDSPDLPPEYINKAFSLHSEHGARVVIGPAQDGGYCLVSLAEERPELFRGISWGSSRVLEETLRLAEATGSLCDGSDVELLPPWYDIDRPEDLRLLCGNDGAPNSARYLEDNEITSRYGLES